MKSFRFCFFIFTCLFLFNPVIAQEEDEIVVTLATESSLSPLYFPPLAVQGSELNSNYIQQLEKVLNFDFEHNGSTFVVKPTAGNDALATASGFQSMGNPKEWKSQNIYYVVKGQINGKSLSFLMFDVQKQNLKSADPIALTGNLSQDRRSLHRIADTIHKAFFNKDGIATTKILFSLKDVALSTKKDQVSEIWEMDYDGGNARQITTEKSYSISPYYIPPKAGFSTGGFVYISYLIGQPKIYAASTKDGKGHRLVQLKGNQLMPTISLQRDKVAFISDVTGNPDLFIQNFSPETGAIGKPQQIFSAKQATQGSPTFSPDGTKVAFVSNKDGSPKIYVIPIPEAGTSLNNIKAALITKVNRENSAPSWSPDGSKIAYCARSKDARQIWIYDFTTNKESQVTSGAVNKENPSWASNSLHLVFNSADKGDSQIYLINLNQSEATAITTGKGDKRFPNWEPRNKR